nr:MAG TPA: cohesin subunit [Caudoviricetes sp.]
MVYLHRKLMMWCKYYGREILIDNRQQLKSEN